MPKFRITAPDGGTYEINAPEGATQDQVLAFAQQQFSTKPSAPAAAPVAPTPDVTAPSTGVAMGLRDAVDAGAQMLRRAVGDKVGGAVDTFGNWLADKGLPVAHSDGVEGVDAIVKGVNQKYEAGRRADAQTISGLVTGKQPEPGFDWGRMAGNILQPANYVGGGAAAGANTIKNLAIAGAKAGAVSGALQPVTGDTKDFWTTKAEQAGAGAVGGAIATPLVAKAVEPIVKGAQALLQRATPAPGADTIRVQVTNILRQEGIDPGAAPREILDSVQQQVQQAMQAGAKLDPAAIVRKAQFEAVGLTGDAAPTLGQATRDPMQFANEKNLSGVRIKTPQGEGNPLADRFQLQNNRLGEVFDQVGARDATDRVTAGQTILDALRGADAPIKKGVDDAYAAARGMTGGRAADLERGAFSQAANAKLDEGMWGRFLPDNIRGLLNDITEGKTPFNVDAAVQIDGILSAAQRKAGKGSPEASAIGVIRDALHATPMAKVEAQAVAPAGEVVSEAGQKLLGAPQPGSAVSFQIPQPIPGAAAAVDEGTAARAAFDQARQAARNRFATIEQTPALQAALDNAAPDKFVQQFILNADVRDIQAMRKVLDNSPEALAQARAQVAEHLKNAAFGVNASGDKAFTADRYMQTLRAIGPEKLKAFFSPEELLRLNLAGKVASDINSIPAGARYGTNTSGTGAALMNLLSKVAESPILRQIPGGRALANQVGEIRTEREISRALAAQPAQAPRQMSPEAVRALQLLFPPAGVAGGVLAGSAVN